MGLSYLEVVFICGFLLSFFILIKQRRQIKALDAKLKTEKIENTQETKKRPASEASYSDSEEVILPKSQMGILEIKKYCQDDARFQELTQTNIKSAERKAEEVEQVRAETVKIKQEMEGMVKTINQLREDITRMETENKALEEAYKAKKAELKDLRLEINRFYEDTAPILKERNADLKRRLDAYKKE